MEEKVLVRMPSETKDKLVAMSAHDHRSQNGQVVWLIEEEYRRRQFQLTERDRQTLHRIAPFLKGVAAGLPVPATICADTDMELEGCHS